MMKFYVVVVLTLLASSLSVQGGLLDPIFNRFREQCCPRTKPDITICYSNAAPYQGLPLPHCADEMNLSFKLYNKRTGDQGQLVSRHFVPAAYDGAKETLFFAHGFVNNVNNPWVLGVKATILRQLDVNLIIINWDEGSMTPNYLQAIADTRPVGDEVALVAENLIRNGKSNRVRHQCVGHSTGAHICGQAGKRLKFRMITGLDPAGPEFDSRDVSAGLNPNSADRVVVWHTGGKDAIYNLGSMRRMGHVDFYVNGGGVQPKCGLTLRLPGFAEIKDFLGSMPTTSGNILQGGLNLFFGGCNHMAAVSLYDQSLTNDCFLSRYQCTDQNKLPQSCNYTNKPVQALGRSTAKYEATGIFYLQTREEVPQCLN